MKTLTKPHVRNSSLSYLALRQTLGVLGLALPILIWIFNCFELKPSISHFYYSNSSVIFTGFMISFGIFLIFYPGRIDHSDTVSDNWITNIGGFGAIITALIPTNFYQDCNKPLNYSIHLTDFCTSHPPLTTIFMHNSKTIGTIHLCAAATFLILMGYMSYARFTKGNTSPKMKIFYKFCAFMIWIPIAVISIEMLINKKITIYDVFIAECLSLSFFGLAWLVKGKTFAHLGFY